MLNRLTLASVAIAFALVPQLASAELKRIDKKSDFVRIVQGKTLSRPMVRLEVSPDGSISGRGVRWDVTGSWSWQDGFFCRELNWGGDDLGYNCQEVRANGNEVRFTSDQGRGDSAAFRLR